MFYHLFVYSLAWKLGLLTLEKKLKKKLQKLFTVCLHFMDFLTREAFKELQKN